MLGFGFGESFNEKGKGQWGRAMQDDLTDGLAWLVSEAARPAAKASPSFFSAFGGSSSTNSSTSRLAFRSMDIIHAAFLLSCSITSSAQSLGAMGKPMRARLSR